MIPSLSATRWRVILLTLAAMALVAPPARAVPFDNKPKILLHLMPVTSKNACTWGSLTDCQQAVTNGQVATPGVGPFYYGYLLAARGNLSGLAGAQFGLSYDECAADGMNNHRGIDIFTWTGCAGVEFRTPTPIWPQPGSGTLITWDTHHGQCQTGEVGVLGYFYMAAYSTDTLRVIPRPVDGKAKVADCTAAEYDLAQADLGSVVFSELGAFPGCNPCGAPCPPPTFECPPPPPPPPPPNLAEPRIMLHIKAATTKNACTWGELADPTQAVTSADLSTPGGPFYFVYLLVFRERLANVAGLQCGVSYENNQPGDDRDGHGIDIFGWTLCASLEFPTPGSNLWPKPGGGNLITWDPANRCQTGLTAVAGYFYVAAYDADRLRIIPRPIDGEAKVATCEAAETIVPEDGLGFASFSRNAETAGCNPVLTRCAPAVPVQPSTWSGIKTLYGR